MVPSFIHTDHRSSLGFPVGIVVVDGMVAAGVAGIEAEVVVEFGVLELRVVEPPGWTLGAVACLCFVVTTTFAVVLRSVQLAAAVVLSVPVLFCRLRQRGHSVTA